ncbi:MAG TPA: antitoxin Xre-like helix-turn-helix domain-containing protein [Rhizobiaceae bacterium]|nr:antitoxin Xre-like helix-turn-helix domain-containing protein [Rhizobiaceae bacterium]
MRRAVAKSDKQAGSGFAPVEVQRFAKEADRTRLSPVALKAYVNLAREWALSNLEAATLLGVSGSTWDRIKRGQRPVLNQDQLTRISALIGIYKGLHLLIGDDAADLWPRNRNTGPLFNNASPIEAMGEGGIPHMLDVRRYIDAVRGGL